MECNFLSSHLVGHGHHKSYIASLVLFKLDMNIVRVSILLWFENGPSDPKNGFLTITNQHYTKMLMILSLNNGADQTTRLYRLCLVYVILQF